MTNMQLNLIIKFLFELLRVDSLLMIFTEKYQQVHFTVILR